MLDAKEIIAELLKKRGVCTDEDIAEFLSDKPKKTYDPSLLNDLEAGVDLILEKARSGAKICVYGDYDADGITATSLMLTILGHLTDEKNLSYYIPSRFEEGYGLNMDAVRLIAQRGTDLMITVDCGSVSIEESKLAQELGMDILVTDHHSITDKMADCLLVNPKRPDSTYPFSGLCGCGVAFKLAQLIQKKAGLPKSVLTEVLDLVAIGTIGDIMPLLDENRTLVKFGMKIVNSGQRYGLRKLIEGASLKLGEISSENVGFVIVPHLNASGRIEDASEAVELMLAPEGSKKADAIVGDLLEKNRQRRALQEETVDSCVKYIEDGNLSDFLLIKSLDAHEGIAGIAAGKIKDKYYRPTVIVTPSGENQEYLKGTGRSIEGVNLYELLKNHEELFTRFGGHAAACGFLMPKENFDKLKSGLLDDMKAIRADRPEVFVKKYPVDLEIEPSDASVGLCDELDLLAPFGHDNPKPMFEMRDVDICDVRYMGDHGQHVRFRIFSHSGFGQGLTCVLFNTAEEVSDILDCAQHASRIIGSLDAQVWQGQKRLQFMVRHMEGNLKAK